MSLRYAITQWVLVRTFGYTARLLHSMNPDKVDWERPPLHLQMLRNICCALYDQIRLMQSPLKYVTVSQSPTAKRFTNQWP